MHNKRRRELVSRMESGVKKAITLAGELLSGLDIKVNYGRIGISIEMDRKSEKPTEHILQPWNVLINSQKNIKKVILFL